MTALNVFRSFDQEATSPGLLGRSVVQLTPKSLINEFYYSKVESFKLRKTGSKTCNLFCKIDGWCSGGNTCLPLMWPGFQSRRRRHMWVLSLLLVLSVAPRDFSPSTPVFSSPQKPAFSNSNSTRNQLDEEPLSGYATSKSLLIFLFFCACDLNVVAYFVGIALNARLIVRLPSSSLYGDCQRSLSFTSKGSRLGTSFLKTKLPNSLSSL